MSRRRRRASARLLAISLLLAAPVGDVFARTVQRRATPNAGKSGPIRVWMRDVVLYPYDDAPSRVVDLSGSVAPTRPGRMVVFDDVTSYGVNVEHAEVRLSPATMTVLMNRYILPAANGAIKHVDVSFGAGVLDMKGTMVKVGAPIPFSATAVASPNAVGDMAIKITKMTAAGVVPKGLMDALGLKMSKVAQPHNESVFYIVGDTMVLPVVSMFPPPKFSGKLRSVTITPTELTAVIGSAGLAASPAVGAKRFIHYRGGSLKFAKLTMQDVDLTVVPKTDDGSLGFSPANYYRQMVAGFTVPQLDRGLVAHVPDYASLLSARFK